MKLCSKCKETKQVTEFCKCKRNKDGLQSKCKTCDKQYRDDNKQKTLDYNKMYRENNKESIAIYQNQYREDNKDYFAKYRKQRIASVMPCVYRIKHITSGKYYIGSTTYPLNDRVSIHFHKNSDCSSPFTGEDRTNWEVTVLCYGTKTQVQELEKELQRTRVKKDVKCLNRRIG